MAKPWEEFQEKKGKKERPPWEEYQPVEDKPEEVDDSTFSESLMQALEWVQARTQAPAFKGLETLGETGDPLEALGAAGEQFGEPSETAPRGAEVLEALGVPEGPPILEPGARETVGLGREIQAPEDPLTMREFAGGVADITVDPLLAVPFGKIAKTGLKATTGTAKAVTGFLKNPKGKTLDALAYVNSNLSGIPQKNIQTYVNEMKKVDELSRKYGTSPEGMARLAQDVREKWRMDLNDFRHQQYDNISKELEVLGDEKFIDVTKMYNALEEHKMRLHKVTGQRASQEIQEIQNLLEQFDFAEVADADGMLQRFLSPKDAYEAKRYLQEEALDSYLPTGVIIKKSNPASRAAKAAAGHVRDSIHKLVPQVKEADANYAKLYNLQKNMNKNILKPEGAPNVIFEMGAGGAAKDIGQMRQIEQMTGKAFLPEAELASAARQFGAPPLLPTTGTGKASLMTATAGVIPYALGAEGLGLMMATGVLASPLALKGAIKAGNMVGGVGLPKIAKNILGGPVKLTDTAISKVHEALSGPNAAQILDAAIKGPVVGAKAISREKTTEMELTPDQSMIYKDDVMDDDELTNIEKAERRNKAMTKGIGVFDLEQEEPEPLMRQGLPDISGVADFLRRA